MVHINMFFSWCSLPVLTSVNDKGFFSPRLLFNKHQSHRRPGESKLANFFPVSHIHFPNMSGYSLCTQKGVWVLWSATGIKIFLRPYTKKCDAIWSELMTFWGVFSWSMWLSLLAESVPNICVFEQWAAVSERKLISFWC